MRRIGGATIDIDAAHSAALPRFIPAGDPISFSGMRGPLSGGGSIALVVPHTDQGGPAMRTMMKVQMHTETANRAIADGSMSAINQKTMARLQPEAAYFSIAEGVRTSFIVFDLNDPSEIPPICEPLFTELNATVELFPVMNGEELGKGIDQIKQAK
jgi:hypothetical protein